MPAMKINNLFKYLIVHAGISLVPMTVQIYNHQLFKTVSENFLAW